MKEEWLINKKTLIEVFPCSEENSSQGKKKKTFLLSAVCWPRCIDWNSDLIEMPKWKTGFPNSIELLTPHCWYFDTYPMRYRQLFTHGGASIAPSKTLRFEDDDSIGSDNLEDIQHHHHHQQQQQQPLVHPKMMMPVEMRVRIKSISVWLWRRKESLYEANNFAIKF